MNRVQSFYEEVLESVYKTEARLLDFENKPEKSAMEMNSWVSKKTKGLIPTIIEKTDLKEVFIVLENALYFKGLWYKPFNAKSTKDKNFHLMNGKTVSVPFMTKKTPITGPCMVLLKATKSFKQPHETEGLSNKISMYIFLPDRTDGLHDLLKVFDSDNDLCHAKYDLD
ncbi:serpin-Z7-like [Rutidosis leptorrhynchoides]|uniref:serpin-Z7-like n=1 Tax=Rutidosis leptorrhynchoides TaxID=125765 RepID=UPI003A991293